MTNPKWNSIILESDPAESNLLKTMLRKHCPQVKVLAEATEISKAIHCLQTFEANLVFCNVLLHDGNAFDMIDQLDGFHGCLVFLSHNQEHALRAFKYNAFDYLLKPVTPEVLLDVVGRLEQRSAHADNAQEALDEENQKKKFSTIILHAAGVQHVVQIADIVRLEGDGNYATAFLNNGEKILVSKPLKHFEDILPARKFFRVHQSHIVNLNSVKSVQSGDAHLINLTNGSTVPLARRKKDPFLVWLSRQ